MIRVPEVASAVSYCGVQVGSERADSFPSSSLRPPEHALLTSVLAFVRTGYYIGYSSSRARGNCSCGLALCRSQPFDNEWTVLWLPHSARAGSYEKAGIQFGQPKQQMLAVGTATPLTHTMHSDTTRYHAVAWVPRVVPAWYLVVWRGIL